MIGFFSFSFLGLQLPWLTQSITFLAVGGIVFFEKSRQAEIMNLLLKKDLELGRSAQSLFLPDHLDGQIGPYSYSITFKPYGPLSGDWVQTFFYKDTAAIAVGDVVGKGPSAALNTSVIAAVWSQHCDRWQESGSIDVGALTKDLSKTIHRMFRGKQFTTFTCVVFSGSDLEVYNVGAPPWLCLTAGDGCKSIRLSTKNPLGITEEIQSNAFKTVSLADNEILIAYTDGAMDGTGSRRILNSNMKKNSQIQNHEELNKLIFDAGKEERLPDDYTVLIISPSKQDSKMQDVA
jgi:serine phosphatase RsbU (regulator of sigma subunit)